MLQGQCHCCQAHGMHVRVRGPCSSQHACRCCCCVYACIADLVYWLGLSAEGASREVKADWDSYLHGARQLLRMWCSVLDACSVFRSSTLPPPGLLLAPGLLRLTKAVLGVPRGPPASMLGADLIVSLVTACQGTCARALRPSFQPGMHRWLPDSGLSPEQLEVCGANVMVALQEVSGHGVRIAASGSELEPPAAGAPGHQFCADTLHQQLDGPPLCLTQSFLEVGPILCRHTNVKRVCTPQA
jgi:hypothetical protein